MDQKQQQQQEQQQEQRRIYIDGIWDLFHSGHVLHLKELKELDGQCNFLIVGIISDKNASLYKRPPIYSEQDRKILIQSCKYVDQVVEDAPLIVNQQFMKDHQIDLVCHGFSNDQDFEKQSQFFKVPIKLNKFRKVQYHHGISTTNIIQKIQQLVLNPP